MFIISTYSNYLTVSLREGSNMIEKSIPLELSILENSNIKLVDEFKKILYNTLYDMKGMSYKNIPVVFILDPLKVDFRFYRNSKDASEEETLNNLFEEINKSKESVYFSLQKKSPLYCQFVAVNKNDLDIIQELADELNLKIKGIFSYLSLITKFANHSGNLIVVTSYLGNIVLTLSESNGIYFNNLYGTFKDISNIKKLVENLKLFKNNGKNSEIISFNFENPEITNKLNLPEIEIPNSYGYLNPIHALVDASLDQNNEDFFNSNFNLDNLVRADDISDKAPVPYLRYAFILILSFMVGGGAYYLSFVDPNVLNNVLSATDSQSNSEEKKSQLNGSEQTLPMLSVPQISSSPSISSGPASTSKDDLFGNVDLSAPTNTLSLPKSTLKVQVLNSTGITGIAKRNAELVKALGYKNVEVGDTKPAIEGTLIKVSPKYKAYKDALFKEFITFKGLKVQENTDSAPQPDILVIIGK